MNQPDPLFSLPGVVRAYCSSVTVASAVVALQVGFLLFVPLWAVAFLFSVLPYAGAIVVARRFSIQSWWYFIGGGLVTAAAAYILFVLVTQYGRSPGPVQDADFSQPEPYAEIFTVFLFAGAMAGLVSWRFFRRSGLVTDAQPCGEHGRSAEKPAERRLP